MSHLLGILFAMFLFSLYHVTAVIATVLQSQIHHDDMKCPVVVRGGLQPMVVCLFSMEVPFCDIAMCPMMLPWLMMQVPFSYIADMLLLRAALVSVAAEVPNFVK